MPKQRWQYPVLSSEGSRFLHFCLFLTSLDSSAEHSSRSRHLLPPQFFLTSDDGSSLYLNEFLIVNNDLSPYGHGMLEIIGSAFLYAGDYVPFRVDFWQGDGGLGLELRWQGPGISKQIVPASAFSLGKGTLR